MANETIQYVAKEGERWDSVSHKVYGTPYEVDRILQANPNVPITPRISGGTVLEIPVIEDFSIKTDLALLPPWKR